MSSGIQIMWIGLLLLSMSCIVPSTHAFIGMTDIDDPSASVESLCDVITNENEEDFDMIGISRRTTFTGTICASVLEDINNDGVGEGPVVGVVVELCTRTGVPVKAGYTDYSGKCCFPSMRAGLYKKNIPLLQVIFLSTLKVVG
jgi:hypothetical protein